MSQDLSPAFDTRRGSDSNEPLLSVRGLTKVFPGVRALDDVSLEVRPHEVVALVGQNGSGKSTLVKILAGIYTADSGTFEVRQDTAATVGAAPQMVHFIHQDLGLIPTLNTIENLDLGRQLGLSALRPIRRKVERAAAQQLVARFGSEFDVELPVERLTAGEQRIVAMARALKDWSTAKSVLVLDEPTVSLGAGEVGHLFDAVRRVASAGAGIVFISHRLDEVLAIADRIVVLRDGHLVANEVAKDVDYDTLVGLIAGSAVKTVARGKSQSGQGVLSVRNLAGASVTDASLAVDRGEIVGVAGILGSGMEHVLGATFGAIPRTGGEVRVLDRLVKSGDPHAAIEAGIGFVPADRHRSGALMEFTARENLTLPHLGPLTGPLGQIHRGLENFETDRWIRSVDLRPPIADRPLRLFSGGNQQKVILAKWLRTGTPVLLLDEPTQGVDVAAKSSIYQMLADAAAADTAVVVSSSDMKELAELCHRVVVFRGGRIVATLSGADLTEQALIRESLGIKADELAATYGAQNGGPSA